MFVIISNNLKDSEAMPPLVALLDTTNWLAEVPVVKQLAEAGNSDMTAIRVHSIILLVLAAEVSNQLIFARITPDHRC